MAKRPDTTVRRRRAAGGRLSREDLALWRRLAATVAPLPGRLLPPLDEAAPSEPLPVAPPPPSIVRRARPAPIPASPAPPLAGPAFPEIGHGDIAGVDKRTAQRMRRGQLPIEARIDLHGLTEADAHRALAAFVIGAQQSGRRCVLVVTGKGRREEGRAGILRRNVPRWLNEPPNRARILAFSHALPRDGGEGALYVLLRRRK